MEFSAKIVLEGQNNWLRQFERRLIAWRTLLGPYEISFISFQIAFFSILIFLDPVFFSILIFLDCFNG